jgi:hypothetical protein
MKKKTCSKCKIEKTYLEYYKNRSRYDGVDNYCKQCSATLNKNKLEKYKNRYSKTRKKYYQQNKGKIAEQKTEQHKKNKEKNLSRSKRWYENNKNKIMSKKKQRRKNDPYYRLVCCLRSRVLSALKGKYKKSAKTLDLTGCSIEELWLHLEKKFTQGMTRENHGFYGWHIDHIIPCDSFDLADPEQQKICFHYTNLQPLWAKDNHSKGNKKAPAE